MTNATLYVLADEYLAAAEKLANLDLDERTVTDTLEGLAGAVEVKATNVAMFVRSLEELSASIRAAELEMARRRKAVEERADRIRAYLKSQMQRTGISKIDGPYLHLALRDNPPRVVVDSEFEIPPKYWRQPDPPPLEIDKRAILEAARNGETIPGAHLETTTRLEIK